MWELSLGCWFCAGGWTRGCTGGWTQVALQVGWKMINLSVRDRAGQSGSRERGPDGKVKSQGILGATPRVVNRPTRWNIDHLYFPSQIQRNIVLCCARSGLSVQWVSFQLQGFPIKIHWNLRKTLFLTMTRKLFGPRRRNIYNHSNGWSRGCRWGRNRHHCTDGETAWVFLFLCSRPNNFFTFFLQPASIETDSIANPPSAVDRIQLVPKYMSKVKLDRG